MLTFKIEPTTIYINAEHNAITTLSFTPLKKHSTNDNSILTEFSNELTLYFNGNLKSFKTPFLIKNGTQFQKKVWLSLKEIPYGETRTYQDIANMVGSPKAYQAVGQALRLNPLPILLPCHRVIKKSGEVSGFFGASSDGLTIKKYLLDLEKKNL
ncbi:methylated-DNA--[protein]-cysteine S-methyltransferase [Vagococcus vulneris]|uniref:methylated-DNA--[protein]-cysteine S-methyltransferase n=1 Tax=Vagococcus vulneris TaxID=1977869 RepID=A0A429ZWS4_9ENTE|nr:methylated-DNA--[protein]-cysteine S-methyltransferase [Vagococcus vulneris]RST98230.1 hypothetical protein CBF37_08665 [Vagococcus vulneris]